MITAVKVITPCQRLEGTLVVPGDKSISHRALILNAIADGSASITNLLKGADCLSTIACLRQLGVEIADGREEGGNRAPEAVGVVRVNGVGHHGLKEPEDVLDAGNSGTSMRLLAGLLAGQPFLSILTGDESLRSRPMGRIVQPLRLMGALIWGKKNDTLAPLAIRGGALSGIEYALPVASAQLKSSLLLAALWAQGATTVVEPAPSRDHTERMLRATGVEVEIVERTISVHPPARSLRSLDIDVPGDISSAAFWLVAAAIHPQARLTVQGVGVNPSRTGILDVLRDMGARMALRNEREVGGEPVADITVESSSLSAVEVGGDLIPRLLDEIPVLAVAAGLAKGATVIRDAAELRVKESDRLAGVAKGLSALGIQVEEQPAGLVIHGAGQLKGAQLDSQRDHRLAMAFAVAALAATGESAIGDADAVTISYPTFWTDLARLSGSSLQ